MPYVSRQPSGRPSFKAYEVLQAQMQVRVLLFHWYNYLRNNYRREQSCVLEVTCIWGLKYVLGGWIDMALKTDWVV